MTRIIPGPASAVVLCLAMMTTGCATVSHLWGGDEPPVGTPGHIAGFLGAVAADEPRAALIGREVLAAGGNAADAATAVGFALSVTLPSRAGLGGGGACLAQRGDAKASGVPDAFMFIPPAATAPGGDRPAAVPMMARGLFLMQARQGRLRFESLLSATELMAREGIPVSRALARDLALVAGPLAGDPGAREIFSRGGRPLGEGDTLLQPALGATLAQISRAGVGDLYVGSLANRLIESAALAGGPISAADLRAAVPSMVPALMLERAEGTTVSFLPLPADGGLAAAAAFQVLERDLTALDTAKARALGAAAAFRRGGGNAQAILEAAPSGTLPALPASTSFAVMDREGNAVVCAVSMGNLFGTGRVAQGTGMLLAASPARLPPPLLAAGMITYRRSSVVRVAAVGSGQEGAPVAVGLALAASMADKSLQTRPNPAAAPEPGRSNVIGCNQGVASPESCGWASDPRGFGLATGSN